MDAVQLIDANGVFSTTAVDEILASSGVSRGEAYQVVSVIGPQSSGKSTLLNTLFGTTFREMVRERRREDGGSDGRDARRDGEVHGAQRVLDVIARVKQLTD